MYSPQQLAQFYQASCMDELQALKPGNVHIFADGHRMVLDDFLQSAEISALPIAQKNLTIGARIFNAVEATSLHVGKNTNLGIILLCAPIIHSALQLNAQTWYAKKSRLEIFKKTLKNSLENLTVSDAMLAAKAIVLANPAGLNTTQQHDVRDVPNVTLLEMMRYAQHEDLIAWQYSNAFEDIFALGVERFDEAMEKWENETWATSWVYIHFLCAYLDSHVQRKLGVSVAQTLHQEALSIKQEWISAQHPRFIKKNLLAWDASLKARGINPGTSADLTVVTLLMTRLL